MANLTFAITTSSGTASYDSPNITDENMQRFVDWVWKYFPQYDVDEITVLPRTPATEAAAFRQWAARQYEKTKERVLREEREEASRSAVAAIPDFT